MIKAINFLILALVLKMLLQYIIPYGRAQADVGNLNT